MYRMLNFFLAVFLLCSCGVYPDLVPQTKPQSQVFSCVPTNTMREIGTVKKIIDGDTIDVEIQGKIYRVRYIGINTPEKGQPFYEEAKSTNVKLVEGKEVLLVKDVSESDQYGRLLRYVFAQDLFVNYEMVRSGYAMAYTYPPDISCADLFVQAQRDAQPLPVVGGTLEHHFLDNHALPVSDIVQPAVESGCDPAYPDVCIVSPPPDLDCRNIPYRNFRVLPPDPHKLDGDQDGIGCES